MCMPHMAGISPTFLTTTARTVSSIVSCVALEELRASRVAIDMEDFMMKIEYLAEQA